MLKASLSGTNVETPPPSFCGADQICPAGKQPMLGWSVAPRRTEHVEKPLRHVPCSALLLHGSEVEARSAEGWLMR